MSEGFIQIRRGLQDHLISGTLGAFDLGVYLILHLQADFRTGLWTGSAPRLMATAARGGSLRDMQRSLRRLAEIGFVKAFHRRGVRGNYRVLINKYEPRTGALKGMRLNAEKSEAGKPPVYEPCAVAAAESDAEDVAVDAPYLELEGRRRKSQKLESTAPASQAPASHPFFEIGTRIGGSSPKRRPSARAGSVNASFAGAT